jgi:uracil-DNA glycosylase
LKNKKIAPLPMDIFKAFELCSYQETKVVIFGQDPYFQDGLANGLAFSVDKNNPIPASLKNIYKEIKNDIGVVLSKNGSLDSWASQGVLLLNSCLTVEVSKPGSHFGAGWENFIKEVVMLLNKKNNLVFLLWGKNAKKYKKYINPNFHLVLTAPHPSPLSAYKGFFGCKHFSKCNAYLKANGIVEINW